jgi:hypothetical protein
MRRLRGTAALSLLLVIAALAWAAPASAGPTLLVGVDDDRIKWTTHAAPILGELEALGAGAIRVTLPWRPGWRHLGWREHTALRRAVAAHRRGLRVVLAVYGRARQAPRDARAREDYCRYVRAALVRYTEIADVVIWNEANSDTFWRPQEGAPAAYAALLARCWDVLHEAVPSVNVLTTTAGSHDPIAFVRALGDAYRASGRGLPLFDAFGHNPYPLHPDEHPTAVHAVYVGQGDYDRLVAAVDAAFPGQPPIWYLETGFQTRPGWRRARYLGRESVARPLSPEGQAVQVAAALRLASCQPRVQAFFNFLLVDEPRLDRWQSGLLWPTWQRKPAFEAARAAIDEIRRGAVDCAVATRRPSRAVWRPGPAGR